MCDECLEEIADARYEGDHERVERIVRETRIDRVTAEEIANARYEGDRERITRIYSNLKHESAKRYDPWDRNNDPDWGSGGW